MIQHTTYFHSKSKPPTETPPKEQITTPTNFQSLNGDDNFYTKQLERGGGGGGKKKGGGFFFKKKKKKKNIDQPPKVAITQYVASLKKDMVIALVKNSVFVILCNF